MGEPPIRVLHWYWQRHAGGIDRVVKDLTHEQAKNSSLKVSVATGCVNGTPNEDEETHVLGFGHGFDFRQLGHIRRLLEGTDLLHMHCYNPVVALAARMSGVPVVYTDHGTDQAKHPRNLVMVWALQRRFVHKRPRLVTVNSQYRQDLQEGFYRRPLRLVYNGLDFTTLRTHGNGPALRASLGLAPREFVVGTVALFQERKRVPLLIEIFREFVQRNPSVKSRLVIVGDGSEREAVEAAVQASGIAGKILLTGFRKDARDLIETMDAFVLPTVGEPFGLAAVEALALERPTLVFSDGGGLVEIIRDEQTGFIVRDQIHAVRRLEQLWSTPAFARWLGQEGRKDVIARFDIAAMEERVYECYEEALRN